MKKNIAILVSFTLFMLAFPMVCIAASADEAILTAKCNECWPGTTACNVRDSADSKSDLSDLKCNLRAALWCANNTDHCKRTIDGKVWRAIYVGNRSGTGTGKTEPETTRAVLDRRLALLYGSNTPLSLRIWGVGGGGIIEPSSTFDKVNCSNISCAGLEIRDEHQNIKLNSNVRIHDVQFQNFPFEAIWTNERKEIAEGIVPLDIGPRVKFVNNAKEGRSATVFLNKAQHAVFADTTFVGKGPSYNMPAISVEGDARFTAYGDVSFTDFNKNTSVINIPQASTSFVSPPSVLDYKESGDSINARIIISPTSTTMPTSCPANGSMDRLFLYKYVESGDMVSYVPMTGVVIDPAKDATCKDEVLKSISIVSSDYASACSPAPMVSAGQLCVQIKLNKAKLQSFGFNLSTGKVVWRFKTVNSVKNSGFSVPMKIAAATSPDTTCTDKTHMTASCQCLATFDGVNTSGTCIKCASPNTYSAAKKACEAKSCSDPTKMTAACVCKDVNASTDTNGKCQCKAAYKDNGSGTCISRCTGGEVWDEASDSCKSTTIECEGDNEEMKPDGACDCKADHGRYTGETSAVWPCVSCGSNADQIRNEDGTLVCDCGDTEVAYRDLTGRCVSISTSCPKNATCSSGIAVCNECYQAEWNWETGNAPTCVKKTDCTPKTTVTTPPNNPGGGCSLLR